MENSHYGNIGGRELLIVINRSSWKRKSNRISFGKRWSSWLAVVWQASCKLRSRFQNSFRKLDHRLLTNGSNGSFKISRVFKVNSLSWKLFATTWKDASKLLATGDQLHLRNIESYSPIPSMETYFILSINIIFVFYSKSIYSIFFFSILSDNLIITDEQRRIYLIFF